MHSGRTNKLISFDLSCHEYVERGIEISPYDENRIRIYLGTLSNDEWTKAHKSVYEFSIVEQASERYGIRLDDYLSAVMQDEEWLKSRNRNMQRFWRNSINQDIDNDKAGKAIYNFTKSRCL